jgi:cell wall-associated NlpC family hydrolase
VPLTPEQRDEAVAEAKEWVRLKTPYVPHAKLKGLGCDCATFIICIFQALGLIPKAFDPGNYSIQAHLHRNDTQYVETVLQFADEITEAEVQPGDIVLWKVARAYAHGGIIVDWPNVIHSMNQLGVIYSNSNVDSFLSKRPRRFFRLK